MSEPSPVVIYTVVAVLSLAIVLILGRLHWPRAALYALSLACFIGALLIIEFLHPWSAQSAWPRAMEAGLVGLTAGAFGVAIRRKRAGDASAS